MTRKRISRRQMLGLVGMGAVGAWVAACAPQPAPTKAPEPTQAGAAAPAPGPTAAPPTVVPAPREPVQIKLVTWGGTVNAEKRDVAVRSAFPDLDERIKTEIITGGKGDADVAKMLRLALAAGQDIPEMLQLNRTSVAEFAAAGETLDLGDVYARYQDDLPAGILELVKHDGKFVCFPNEVKTKVFYYRGDMFADAGIDVADMKTTNDLISAGTAFHAKFPEGYILNLGPQPASYWLGEILSAYPDARIADDSGAFRVTQEKAFADAFKFLKDIADAKIALPTDDWSSDWEKAFSDSAIGSTLSASWMKLFLPKFVPAQGGKWKYGLWPTFSPLADQRYGSDGGGSVFILPKRSAHPEEAIEYMSKCFLEKQGALACHKAMGLTPLVKSAKDELMALVRDASKPEDVTDQDWAVLPAVFFGADYVEFELETFEYLKIMPYDPSATKEIGILNQWLVKYVGGEATLDQALAGAEADMKSQIGNPFEV